MRRASRFMFAAVVAAGLLVASATVASAQPTRTTSCAGSCHPAGTAATIAASLVSTTSTDAIYNVAMTGPTGSAWAVFDGSTKLVAATTTTGTFTVALGKTYDVYAVSGTTPFSSVATQVSPAAPSVEPTASLDETVPPVTTADAESSYVGTASVELEATDGDGQGVAYIYYSIDGNRTHLFTVGMVSEVYVEVAPPIVGSANHTMTYWSQDKAGNVEAPKTVSFSVAAPLVAPVATSVQLFTPSRYTVYHNRAIKFSGRLTPRMASQVTLEIRKASWRSYHELRTVSTSGSGYFSYNYTVRTDRAPGTYYVHARYLGSDGFTSSVSAYKKFVIK